MGTDLNELLGGLWVLIGTAVSLTIMFLIVSYFFYFPAKKYISEKHKYVQHEIDTAVIQNQESAKKLREVEKQMRGAATKVNTIIAEGQTKAFDQKQEILKGAKKEATVIVDDAMKVAKQESNSIRKNAESEIASIVIYAVEKIIKREINSEINNELINELIDQLKNE